ncbi:hypothetical protein SOASR030_19300 [Leminorella grimontii]|uniref:High mobility group protein Z n=1 Tax=Leminorella grimontii TaxID=82981 RepID=A0AAV5N2S6_9GAMM|nr:hypothetical protein SOASR030_19300 [Leminorella grimontii]GKX59621.1 hypothetical protein SOASR031_19360 [Leminorella grimontii]VFS55101.1 Uncharacterised protein [Leminorella grimontii]
MQWLFPFVGLLLACYLVWLLGRLLWLNRLKDRRYSAKYSRGTKAPITTTRPRRRKNKTE